MAHSLPGEGEGGGDVEAAEEQAGGVAGFGVAVAIFGSAGHEDRAGVAGAEFGVFLMKQCGGAGDVGRGEAGAVFGSETAGEGGHFDTHAWGEEIEFAAAARDQVVMTSLESTAPDGEDAGIGGGVGDAVLADRAALLVVAVSTGGGDKHAHVVQGLKQRAQLRIGLCGGVVS